MPRSIRAVDFVEPVRWTWSFLEHVALQWAIARSPSRRNYAGTVFFPTFVTTLQLSWLPTSDSRLSFSLSALTKTAAALPLPFQLACCCDIFVRCPRSVFSSGVTQIMCQFTVHTLRGKCCHVTECGVISLNRNTPPTSDSLVAKPIISTTYFGFYAPI